MNTNLNKLVPLTAEVKIQFNKAVALDVIRDNDKLLRKSGIYFLVFSVEKPSLDNFNPCGESVIYIGKGISETIYNRVRKHVATISGLPTPKTRPGKNFVAYSKRVGSDINNHWVIAGVMDKSRPYEISYAEEFFICHYQLNNDGKTPPANTAKALS